MAKQYTIDDFSENEISLMIAADPVPQYTLYFKNGKFGLFANTILEMGYWNKELFPIGKEFGYDKACYCNLQKWSEKNSAFGYLALGTDEGWVIYNMSFNHTAEVKASGESFDEACRALDNLLGVDMSRLFEKIVPIRYTPERISSLKADEVFVFGSNLAGHHGGGAARFAYDNFGAEWGVGVGPTGQCYAIPTMHGGPDSIKPYVDEFIAYARENTHQTFLVTPIGCGIAGFKVSEIAPLFRDALDLDNVVLPESFVKALE